MSEQRKWYQETGAVILFCIFVPVVGFILLWLNPRYKKDSKIVASCFIGPYMFLSLVIAIALFNGPIDLPASHDDSNISEGTQATDESETTTATWDPVSMKYRKHKSESEASTNTTDAKTENSTPTINTLDNDTAAEMVKQIDESWKGVAATVTSKTGFVLIEFETDFWDENDSVFKTNKAASKMMPLFFETDGVKAVNVQLNADFTDQYGKSEKSKAVAIELTKETADKVDWDNILSTNRAGLLNIADHKYIHPGTLKNIDNEDILAAYQQ